MNRSPNKKPKVISLFSGAGGMDLGFIQAGFEIVFANDFDKDACLTYSKNFNHKIINKDISLIKDDEIPKCDVLIGGFPCQGFSISNIKRRLDDPRNMLYKKMLRFIRISKPKVVVAENVKGILSLGNGSIFNAIIKDLNKIGYKVEHKVLNSVNFGVPQKRERVIIIASKNKKILFPKEINKMDFITTKEVCNHLENVPITYLPIKIKNKIIYNHMASTNVHDKFWARKYKVNQPDICDYLKKWKTKAGISTRRIDEIFCYRHTVGHWFRKGNKSGSIPNPNDWKLLKTILKFDNKYDKRVTTMEERRIVFEQRLRITKWDKPSATITAHLPEIHVNKKRRLSVRECAIIQTFPDDFIFYGSLGSMYKQVGNAVPVKFAKLIAQEVIKQL